MSKNNPTYSDMVKEWLTKFDTPTFIVDRKYDESSIKRSVSILSNQRHEASFRAENRNGIWCIVAYRHYDVEVAI